MKLQAKDIRVCNWVSKDGEQYQAGAATITALERGDYEVDPIPLTEEWLRRGGFEGDSITGAYVKYKLKSLEIWFDVAKNTFLLENIKNKKVYLPYVHNLQNAYHLIEGEEIEFNQT